MIVEDSHSNQVHTKNGKQHGSNSKGILCRADLPQHLQSSEQRQTPQSHRDILEVPRFSPYLTCPAARGCLSPAHGKACELDGDVMILQAGGQGLQDIQNTGSDQKAMELEGRTAAH